jgi:hypothetical protein
MRVWIDEPSSATSTPDAMAAEVKGILRISDDSSNSIVKVRGPPNLVVASQNKGQVKNISLRIYGKPFIYTAVTWTLRPAVPARWNGSR